MRIQPEPVEFRAAGKMHLPDSFEGKVTQEFIQRFRPFSAFVNTL